jgi:hypothetical protein
MVYPAGGFGRAIQYLRLRLTRLPDEPHRIARGVFAGVFMSFTPFLGFHFLLAALLAWMIRGNILAAMLATFVGNPLTTPFIAITSVGLGNWMMGQEERLSVLSIITAFSHAGGELWRNAKAVFTDAPVQWASLQSFFETIFLPYLVGGLLPGLLVGLLFYWGTVPLLRAYQRIRAGKLRNRVERRPSGHSERRQGGGADPGGSTAPARPEGRLPEDGGAAP